MEKGKMINKKYRVTAQILTPLHIGVGAEKDWVEGVDFIVKDGYMHHLNINKMYEAGVDMNKVTAAFTTGRLSDIPTIIGNKLNVCSDFQMPMPCLSTNPIKVFLRNQLTGKPIIAGSSLKGAIRSILFKYLRNKGETSNNAVFGDSDKGTDFMRFIRIGDFEFCNTELVNTKIFNLESNSGHWQGGWKHKGGKIGETNAEFHETGFNTIYECLPVGSKSDGSISIANVTFDKAKSIINVADNPNKSKIINNNITFLCDIINKHTKQYLIKELDFFKRFQQAENSDFIYADEDDFSGGIVLLQGEFTDLKPNECILKMSAGSGFHVITGDWQFDNYTHGTFDRKNNKGEHVLPKSRKIAITYDGDDMYLDLMGFIKLTFEEVE